MRFVESLNRFMDRNPILGPLAIAVPCIIISGLMPFIFGGNT